MATPDSKSISLENERVDYLTALAKSALGAVPYAGSLLAEIVGSIIPDQRVDRLVRFARELGSRIAALDEDSVRAKLANENFTDLVEEAMRYAARSLTDERRRYLAALLANGIKTSSIDYIESKHILRILGELNDVEVLWLRSYLVPTVGGDEEFRRKHAEVLEPVRAHMGSDQSTLDREALQESYKQHLVRLGLLDPDYDRDSKTKGPLFDSFRGGFKLRGYDITSLGRLLLRQIELTSPDQS